MIRLKKVILLVAILLIGLIVSGCGKPDVTGTYTCSCPGEPPYYLVIYQNGTWLFREVGDVYTHTGRWEVKENYKGDSDWLIMYWDKYGLISGFEIKGNGELVYEEVNGICVKQEGAL